jgi:glycine oxidase
MKLKMAIIGDGIIGLTLAWRLKERYDITIYGNGDTYIPSVHGAAVINPIANKKNQIVADFDLKQQNAIALYQDIEMQLGIAPLVLPITLLKVVGEDVTYNKYIQKISPQAQLLFQKAWHLDGSTLAEVHGAAKVNTQIVQYLRIYFELMNNYKKLYIDTTDVAILAQLKQKYDIIICCEGTRAKDNPLYQSYKLTRNRGNILYIRIPELSTLYIYDLKYKIVPFKDDIFWVGSNNEWNYTHGEVNSLWRDEVLAFLKDTLHLSFEVLDHVAIERPTIAGQQPIYGQCEHDKQIWICNGLGTRGYSNGPYITHLLAQKIINTYN